MIDEIRVLVADYSAWLREKHTLRSIGDEYVEITTPFVDRNNDHLQIYAKRGADGFVLTDAGETIADLRFSGCDLDTDRRQAILKTTINGFAVSAVGDALETNATADTFALRKHNLVQAMLAVNDLFHLAAPSVASLFHEDVERWFNEMDVRSTPNVRFVGKSGLDQHFDFAIPASRQHPERLVSALAAPSRQRVSSLMFAWEDIRDRRSPGARCVAILNDERPIRPDLLHAVNNYGIRAIKWSERMGTLPDLMN